MNRWDLFILKNGIFEFWFDMQYHFWTLNLLYAISEFLIFVQYCSWTFKFTKSLGIVLNKFKIQGRYYTLNQNLLIIYVIIPFICDPMGTNPLVD